MTWRANDLLTTRDCKPVGNLKGTAGILIILFQVRAQVRRKQANYIAGQQFLANNCAPPKGKTIASLGRGALVVLRSLFCRCETISLNSAMMARARAKVGRTETMKITQ